MFKIILLEDSLVRNILLHKILHELSMSYLVKLENIFKDLYIFYV